MPKRIELTDWMRQFLTRIGHAFMDHTQPTVAFHVLRNVDGALEITAYRHADPAEASINLFQLMRTFGDPIETTAFAQMKDGSTPLFFVGKLNGTDVALYVEKEWPAELFPAPILLDLKTGKIEERDAAEDDEAHGDEHCSMN